MRSLEDIDKAGQGRDKVEIFNKLMVHEGAKDWLNVCSNNL